MWPRERVRQEWRPSCKSPRLPITNDTLHATTFGSFIPGWNTRAESGKPHVPLETRNASIACNLIASGDGLQDWRASLDFLLRRRDPRRLWWLTDWLAARALPAAADTKQCVAVLVLTEAVLHAQRWRNPAFAAASSWGEPAEKKRPRSSFTSRRWVGNRGKNRTVLPMTWKSPGTCFVKPVPVAFCARI